MNADIAIVIVTSFVFACSILVGLNRASKMRQKYIATGKKTKVKVRWWNLLP
jgi:hypothetical protein